MTTSTLRMSLPDIARLAGVQRPVVSMWRQRELAEHPFPRPVETGAQEWFDAFEVAEYLVATGRGNAKFEREDVAAHASLAGELADGVQFDALTALLALDVLGGERIADLPADDLRALAADADPTDALLRREIESAGDALAGLAAHAEALADASYSAVEAFELLLRQRTHRGLPAHSLSSMRPEALRIGARVARALANHAGWTSPLLVDPTDGGGDLLLQAAREYDEGSRPTVATRADDTPTERLTRRRMAAHDLHRLDVRFDEDGDLQIDGSAGPGAVYLLQLPTVASPQMSDAEALELIDNVLVQLDDDARMVVLGPASALTDPPSSPDVEAARDAVLRTDRLRAAVRLPDGLLVRQPRRHLALWALGPAPAGVDIADRWMVVGDLSNGVLDDATIADTVTDVAAAMAGPREASAHAYRFARRARTAPLLAGGGSLVAPPSQSDDALTLAEAIRRGLCRIQPGNNVEPGDLISEGRAVVGLEELLGTRPVGSRAVDAVLFPAAYSAVRYTEVGDVIFTTSPPSAYVDRVGGRVVLSPARVLRLAADAPLLPDVVADDIRAASGRQWRRWPLRAVTDDDRRRALRIQFDDLGAEREEVLRRLADLDVRRAALIDDAAPATRTAVALRAALASRTAPATHSAPATRTAPERR